jgi:hypothetical protein
MKYINAKRFGRIMWIRPLLDVMLCACHAIGNIEHLKQEAQAIIECNREVIDKFCTASGDGSV